MTGCEVGVSLEDSQEWLSHLKAKMRGLSPQGTQGVPTNRGKARRYTRNQRLEIGRVYCF